MLCVLEVFMKGGEKSMFNWFINLFRSDKGISTEYALILALVAVAIIFALGALGDEIRDTFKEITDVLGDRDKGGGTVGE